MPVGSKSNRSRRYTESSSGTRSCWSGPRETVTEVAREIGVSAEGMRNWVKRDAVDRGQGVPGELTSTEREEPRRPRAAEREQAETTRCCEKAAVFFTSMPPPRASSHCSKRRSAPATGRPGRCPHGDLRLHRDLLQPQTTTEASGWANRTHWRSGSGTSKNTPRSVSNECPAPRGKVHRRSRHRGLQARRSSWIVATARGSSLAWPSQDAGPGRVHRWRPGSCSPPSLGTSTGRGSSSRTWSCPPRTHLRDGTVTVSGLPASPAQASTTLSWRGQGQAAGGRAAQRGVRAGYSPPRCAASSKMDSLWRRGQRSVRPSCKKPERADVFVWEHEERQPPVGGQGPPGLLGRSLRTGGDDWYRSGKGFVHQVRRRRGSTA